ncbi:hypothetical protein Dimus_022719, partial [Dionaea muscipula]
LPSYFRFFEFSDIPQSFEDIVGDLGRDSRSTKFNFLVKALVQVPSRHAFCEESLELTVAEKARLKEVFARDLRKEELPKYFDLINAQTLEVLKVVSERGGGHIAKGFQPLLGLTTEAVAGTSEVPVKKISRKKNPAASGAADVEQIEVPSKGTVSNTQESEAITKKEVSRARPKRLRKQHVISPVVGDNLLDIEEAAEEEEEEEETLVARSRRLLLKTNFDEV